MSRFLQTLADAVSSGAVYGLAALGLGLVFGVMRLANFAHSELITAPAYALVLLWSRSPLLALVTAVAVGVLLAVAMDLVVFRRLRSSGPATLLIASFALSFVLQRVFAILFGNNVRTAPVASSLSRSVEIAGLRLQLLSLVTVLLAVVLMLGLQLFLTRTSIGLQVQAASTDFLTARLLGVRAGLVISATFAISGLLAAAVAFALVTQTGAVSPTFGLNITVLALIGAVIGGIDKLEGALLGGFLVGFAGSELQAWLPSDAVNFKDAYVFVLVIIVLLIRPSGLLASRTATERT